MSEPLCINPACGHTESTHRPDYQERFDPTTRESLGKTILLRRCAASGCDCEEYLAPKDVEP